MGSLVEGKDGVPVGVLADNLCSVVSPLGSYEDENVAMVDLLPSASVLGPPVLVAIA